MRFGYVGMDMESRNIASDEVEGHLGFCWDVDAQLEGSLEEMLVHLVFGLIGSQDHDAIGFIIIILLCRCRIIGVLHVRHGPLLWSSHLLRVWPGPIGFAVLFFGRLKVGVHDGFVASLGAYRVIFFPFFRRLLGYCILDKVK